MHLTMMAISFGNALFSLFVELRNNPEFLPLMNRDPLIGLAASSGMVGFLG